MYPMDMSNNQSDSANSDVQPNKRRRKKSSVWEYFTIVTISADCRKACCKLCNRSFAYMSGSKMSGTSHLKRHIDLRICPVKRHNDQANNLLNPCTTVPKTDIFANGTDKKRKPRQAKTVASTYLNVDDCRHELAKMIIQHGYPLHMVTHPGFVSFTQMLQPQFAIPSISALEDQIMDIYHREKHIVKELLGQIPGHLNLTVDVWTTNQNLSYVLLTGHFIDHDWKMHRRILNAVPVGFSGSDTAFRDAIARCLADWSSENKLFTITLDCSYIEGNIRESLKSVQLIKNSVILNDQLVVNDCFARLLRDLAQDAMRSMKETVEKIRYSVKHVKTSRTHEDRFTQLKQQLQVPGTSNLVMDDLKNWNSTYEMLKAAIELKEVFSCLDASDPDYKANLTMEDWRQVETLCKCLKVFADAARILTSPVYPTADLFFHEACKIHVQLMHAAVSQDDLVSGLTKPLLERFSKYWLSCSMVLAISVVMDPRFKMKLVEFTFKKIYGEDADAWSRTVDHALHELYFDYVGSLPPPPSSVTEESIDPLVKSEVLSQDDGLITTDFSDCDIYIPEFLFGQHMKSELDQYLEESLFPCGQDWDVLVWWEENRSRYPTLAKLAADVLSIPLSIVTREAVFDTRERVLDNHLTSLNPKMLQAVVCAKDWLQHESLQVPATPVKQEFWEAAEE
ncbi:zinc finger BED domain-containing protein DAYSLEEPER-like [Andrographis paniculata]|uniref:zinc finger BED domain-containing protein DAYSLEEPER-like n=1 Tax=Andrographis paniculata TaxID=175694 RepID=UPI0021E738B9|nr:zinc finger BED domain-containing protein DAYSLEEPER-like [Andrographis paniculata]